MRRTDVDRLPGFGIDPPADNAATGEGESVRLVLLEDGDLKLAIKRRGGDRLPLHKNKLKCCLRGHLDLNQTDRPIVVGLTNIKIISSGWA